MTHATLTRPTKSNQQIQEYLSAVDKGLTGRFIMQTSKGWYLREPTGKNGNLFASKTEATTQAKRELANSTGELFIFDKNGQLIKQQ